MSTTGTPGTPGRRGTPGARGTQGATGAAAHSPDQPYLVVRTPCVTRRTCVPVVPRTDDQLGVVWRRSLEEVVRERRTGRAGPASVAVNDVVVAAALRSESAGA